MPVLEELIPMLGSLKNTIGQFSRTFDGSMYQFHEPSTTDLCDRNCYKQAKYRCMFYVKIQSQLSYRAKASAAAAAVYLLIYL